MAVLKNSTREKILQSLDHCILSRYAFNVLFDEEDSRELVRIEYGDYPAYFLEVSLAAFVTTKYRTTAVPGSQLLDQDQLLFDDLDEVVHYIPLWLERVVDEVQVQSSVGRFSRLRQEFEKQLESLPAPDAACTEAEAEAWSARIERLFDRVDQLHDEQQVSRAEISQLREELDRLKGNLTSMPKRTVLRAAGMRVFEYMDKKLNLAMTTAIETTTKQLLGPGPGSS